MGIDYRCEDCRAYQTDLKQKHFFVCNHCGGSVKGEGVSAILNTRDSFGIGKEFVDQKTGQTIDTWGKWEKAGYRDAEDTVPSNIKNEVKRKKNKIEKFDKGWKSY